MNDDLNCVACEGKPAGTNNPCAVCGRATPPSPNTAPEVTVTNYGNPVDNRAAPIAEDGLRAAAVELLKYLDDHDWSGIPEGATADRLRAAIVADRRARPNVLRTPLAEVTDRLAREAAENLSLRMENRALLAKLARPSQKENQ